LRHLFYRFLFALTLLDMASGVAHAEPLQLCYDYGCAKQLEMEISGEARDWLAGLFDDLHDATIERSQIQHAVQALYLLAAQDSPLWHDKGADRFDNDADGRMDCIDHSHNDSAFLHYLAAQGWLHFHRVDAIVRRTRYLVAQHFASHIIEQDTGQEWVVDSWFNSFGEPPVVVPLALWKEGFSP
jgi:hypothetical protein